MRTLTGLVAGCILVAGCSAPKAPPAPAAFQADDNSGKPKRAAQAWIAANKDWSADKDLGAILAQPENRGVKDLLASPQCSEAAPKTSAARAASPSASVFVVGGTRLVSDLYTDKDKSERERLKHDALDASSVDVTFSAAGFRGIRCVVYARYAEGDAPARPGLLAVLAIEQKLQEGKFTDYFRFRPLYVRAGNTVARTAAGNASQPARIAVSFALVARQLVVDNQGAATFAELGSAATTVARVPLGEEGVSCTQTPCSSMSPPMPVPVARGTVVMSMGVSEAGDVGADIDQLRVEREAVKTARGAGPLSPPAAQPVQTQRPPRAQPARAGDNGATHPNGS